MSPFETMHIISFSFFMFCLQHEGRNGNPRQYFCLENPKDKGVLVGYNPEGHRESDTTEWVSRHAHTAPWSACRILLPWTGIKRVRPAAEAQKPNHWTARKVPESMTILLKAIEASCSALQPRNIFFKDLANVSLECKHQSREHSLFPSFHWRGDT